MNDPCENCIYADHLVQKTGWSSVLTPCQMCDCNPENRKEEDYE